MSEFLTEDISELLNAKETPKMSEDEKALAALKKDDDMLINTFTQKQELSWPEPVRKRYIR